MNRRRGTAVWGPYPVVMDSTSTGGKSSIITLASVSDLRLERLFVISDLPTIF
jgi:hypothetical protein